MRIIFKLSLVIVVTYLTCASMHGRVSLVQFCISPTHKMTGNRVLVEIGSEVLRYRGSFQFVRTKRSIRDRETFGAFPSVKDSDLAVVPIVVARDVRRLSEAVSLSGVRAFCNGIELRWAEAGSFKELGDDEQVKVAYIAFALEKHVQRLDSYVIEVDFTQPCEQLDGTRRAFCYFENYLDFDEDAVPQQTVIPSEVRFEVRGLPRVELRRPNEEARFIDSPIERRVQVPGLYEFVIE